MEVSDHQIVPQRPEQYIWVRLKSDVALRTVLLREWNLVTYVPFVGGWENLPGYD